MKKIYYIFISFVIFTTSCEDLLDKAPLDKIENDVYWQKASDLENYVVQFYAQLPAYESLGRTGIFGVDASEGSDDAIVDIPNTTLNGARPTINAADKNKNWNWVMIRNINTFFDNYYNCQEDFSTWSHFLGEAYFFRAWFYFDKVKNYGDVPWYNTTLSMDSQDLYRPRDKRTVVIDSVLQDLDKAISYLKPLKETNGGNNRLSKEAALIFKSRVALFEGTWQKYHKGTVFATEGIDPKKYFKKAVEACEELMSGKYTVGLYGNNSTMYGEMFGQDDMSSNPEIILWKKYDKNMSLSHNAQMYMTARTNDRSATLEFIESFLSKTGNPIDYYSIANNKKGNEFLTYLANNSDPRLAQTIWIPNDIMWDNDNGKQTFKLPYIGQTVEYKNTTGFQLKKGVNIHSAGAGATFVGQDSETGGIIFRYAEALLNYAEAKYELDGNVDYNKSINLLRERVGMPKFKVQKDPNAKRYSDYGYTISDELFEIRRERRVELGAEGFRSQDYRRWRAHTLFKNKRPKGYPLLESEFPQGTPFPDKDGNGLLDPFAKSLPNGYQFDENRDYLMCIPTNEITLNPNLEQNPGW